MSVNMCSKPAGWPKVLFHRPSKNWLGSAAETSNAKAVERTTPMATEPTLYRTSPPGFARRSIRHVGRLRRAWIMLWPSCFLLDRAGGFTPPIALPTAARSTLPSNSALMRPSYMTTTRSDISMISSSSSAMNRTAMPRSRASRIVCRRYAAADTSRPRVGKARMRTPGSDFELAAGEQPLRVAAGQRPDGRLQVFGRQLHGRDHLPCHLLRSALVE